MKKQEAHKRTLEFLDKFINSKGDVLDRIINKHKNTINGPTYTEYLYSLNENYEDVDYIVCQPLNGFDWNEMNILEPMECISTPPILKKKNKVLKKDSVIIQSLFFYV